MGARRQLDRGRVHHKAVLYQRLEQPAGALKTLCHALCLFLYPTNHLWHPISLPSCTAFWRYTFDVLFPTAYPLLLQRPGLPTTSSLQNALISCYSRLDIVESFQARVSHMFWPAVQVYTSIPYQNRQRR